MFKQAGRFNTDIILGFYFSPNRCSTKLDLVVRSQRGCKTAENTPSRWTAGPLLAALKQQTHVLKLHQNLRKLKRLHECVRLSVCVINHVKSETAVHGYCINTLLACMTLKCGVKARGDKRGEQGRR